MFPWGQPKQPEITPRELFLKRLAEGVPPELAATAAGLDYVAVREQHDVKMAVAEGEILLFERARDSGVTGAIRAAMRREANSWLPSAEPNSGATLEDLLRD